MTTVLFKGKQKNNGEWVYGHYTPLKLFETGYFIITDTLEIIEIDRDTVCQCIGLKDNNNKFIFENDIVKDSFVTGTVIFSTEDVWSCSCCNDSFDGSGFIAKSKHGLMHLSDCEVIGNIHDDQSNM